MKSKTKVKLTILSGFIVLLALQFCIIISSIDRKKESEKIDLNDPNIERAMQIDRLQLTPDFDSDEDDWGLYEDYLK